MLTFCMIMYSAPTGFDSSSFHVQIAGTGTDVISAMYRIVATCDHDDGVRFYGIGNNRVNTSEAILSFGKAGHATRTTQPVSS
jgi:hypothetical protein